MIYARVQSITSSCIFNTLDALHNSTCEFVGDRACAFNMLGLNPRRTYDSIFLQFVSATPSRSQAARRSTPTFANSVSLSGGGSFHILGGTGTNCFT